VAIIGRMRHSRIAAATCAAAVAIGGGIAAQGVRTADDRSVLDQIRREGTERSQVMTAFDQFVTVIGARLTGSPAHKQAADWARDTFARWGLANSHLEAWEFGRGWVLDGQVIEMLEPRYMPLIGYAEAWAAPTKSEINGTPIMIGGRSAADVGAMRDKLAGAIVLTQPIPVGAQPAQGARVQATATGDLTLHGVTRRVSIDLEGQLSGALVLVVGSLEITFADYGIQSPRAASVLSVEDKGTLELQLSFTKVQ